MLCFTAMKTIGKSSYPPPPHPPTPPPQKYTRYQTYFKLGKNQRNSATNTGEEEEEEQLKPSHLPRGGVSWGNHFGKAENSTKAKHPPILMTE